MPVLGLGNDDSQAEQHDTRGWYLEGFGHQGKTWLIHLEPLPFVIGRKEGCNLRLSSAEVSRRHAEIHERNGELWIKECGSTNGTFVNRRRVRGDRALHNGDILHFGTLEFRVSKKTPTPVNDLIDDTTSMASRALPQGFVNCVAEFDEMLRQRQVTPYYQPLVRLIDRRIVGFELLGRGSHIALPSGPGPLLRIAESLGREVELSELFRNVGLEKAQSLSNDYHLFFNTVPPEMNLTFLERSLGDIRSLVPFLQMVMEVHETAVTDLNNMRNLRALLDSLNIKLAYDDFGAGQARLLELMEVPPDYLKFDIMFIRNIHLRPAQSLQVIETLVRMAQDLGIKTLAEGVEVAEEVNACERIGFDFAQGHFLGEPAPEFVIN